jgi:hypothetical protein
MRIRGWVALRRRVTQDRREDGILEVGGFRAEGKG